MTDVAPSCTPRQVKFAGCSRCHGGGHDLLFKPFVSPIEVRSVVFSHWAMCPSLNEPILLTTFDFPDDEGITPIETEPLLGSPFDDGRDRSDFEAFGG